MSYVGLLGFLSRLVENSANSFPHYRYVLFWINQIMRSPTFATVKAAMLGIAFGLVLKTFNSP